MFVRYRLTCIISNTDVLAAIPLLNNLINSL